MALDLTVDPALPFDKQLKAFMREFEEYDAKIINPGGESLTAAERSAIVTAICYMHGLGPHNPRAVQPQKAEETNGD